MVKSNYKLLERQSELGEKIIALSNKIDEENVQEKVIASCQKQLEDSWSEFQSNHSQLMAKGITKDDYFEINYFQQMNEKVEEIRSKIVEISSRKVPTQERMDEKPSSSFSSVLQEKIAKLRHLIMEATNTTNGYTQGILAYKRKFIEEDFIKIKELVSGNKTQMAEINNLEDECRDAALKITLMIDEFDQIKNPSSAKLQDITIPVFYGDINEWPSFHDLFKNMVHDHRSMSKVEKLYRLKAVVKGEAGRIIQHLKITDVNYEAAWLMLKQRFENRRLLFTTQIDKLLDLPMANSDVVASVKNLLDSTNECLNSLKGLNIPLKDAEPIIAWIIVRKLDRDGLKLYEQQIKKTKEIPMLEDVLSFLEQQLQSLEALKGKKHGTSFPNRNSHRQVNMLYATTKQNCGFCKKIGHETSVCRNFLKLTSSERKHFATKNKICYKCLKHKIDTDCKNKDERCSKCGYGHHTLLHIESITRPTSSNQVETAATMTTESSSPSSVLQATAQVRVKSVFGEFITLRALIDQGSQRTAVSEEAAQMLQLPRQKVVTELQGLGNTIVGVSKSKIKINIMPRFCSNVSFYSDALVLKDLTNVHPDKSFLYDKEVWKNYTLADPSFNKADRIDLIIGADLYADIMESGIIKNGKILGQQTKLGVILSGVLNKSSPVSKVTMATTQSLERFWEIEDIASNFSTSTEDELCMELYNKTTQRRACGKFEVKLPLKDDQQLGDSKKQAIARLMSLERKLDRDGHLREEYSKFMREYLQLGHMKPVKKNEEGKYYLPHQPVIRENSLTTKLRVVFDASAKTSNTKSLNDIMWIGPRLQKDIFEILIKWRLWNYALTADVEKMYRQILLAEEHQSFLHLFWRENKTDPIKEYKLTTVTYGTASAPFLAVRTLMEIAENSPNEELKQIIKDDFYMDDLLTGADTIEECILIKNNIKDHLEKYNFHLRKWLSNDIHITGALPTADDEEILKLTDDETIKTLGVQWNPRRDTFSFNIDKNEDVHITKRRALSHLARIFDPLGFLSPVTVVVKLFIQKLWLLNTSWDAQLEDDLMKEWNSITNKMCELKYIEVPRWLKTIKNVTYELHGFADASEKAYAAVIYLKTNYDVILLTGKSKVNPIKNKKTLPKLELCAAHLLAKLMQRVREILKRDSKILAWTDSTITLAWIKNEKSKDKFIRTRVADIKNMIPEAKWGHVSTKHNPADVASRGIYPEKLQNFSLWWNGPPWLKNSNWSDENIFTEEVAVANTTTVLQEHFLEKLISKISSLRKLERITAYVIRFIGKLRRKQYPSYLTTSELNAAMTTIIKYHQQSNFSIEMKMLQNTKEIKIKSKIAALHPFLDSENILRVGGRLQNSNLQFMQKHPIILGNSPLSRLIVQTSHQSTLHGGNQIIENLIRRKYWIINLKKLIKSCVRNCVRCTRYRRISTEQLMGNLPAPRVSIAHPFTHTGIDYAGPVFMKCSKGRGQKLCKGYISVFVCLSTKAIHLEAVSDLTSDAFLAALRRFFSRRGKSHHLYSDNGTNFIGAQRQLDKELKDAIKQNCSIIPILEADRTQWHFIPPAAPHFGGMWEAGVKAVKYHLKRVIGDTKLTFEEMTTILCQIEAVLNSRPLYAVHSEGEAEYDVLTPGHFLIGQPLLDHPEAENERTCGSLNKWKMIQKMKHHFWQRWKEEYLQTLQRRYKWQKSNNNLTQNQICLIKNENTSPTRWPLGKIMEVHPGKDGIVRVVTLKTQDGIIKRPITKVCPLLTEATEETRKTQVSKTMYVSVCKKNEKQPLSYFGNLKVFIILLLMLCSRVQKVWSNDLAKNESSEIIQLKSNATLYLDQIGNVDIMNSKWSLIIYYDLEPYFRELEHAELYIKRLQSKCQLLVYFEEPCKIVSTSLEQKLVTLKSNNNLLLKPTRVRRAPFEFIGSLHHILFGIMDSEDRKDMEQNLQNVLDNQHDIKQLVKKQTSVIDSTLNILKKTTEEVNSHFTEMTKQLNRFYHEIVISQNQDRMAIMFHIMSTQLSNSLNECERIQISIINLIIDLNHGHINTQLVNPLKLEEEIVRIHDSLPSQYTIPGWKQGLHIKNVLNLMKARPTIIDSRLIINAEIPLVYGETSQLYRIIPIPITYQNDTIIADLKKDFVVYNFKADIYILLSQDEIRKCTKGLDMHFMCKGNWPWRTAGENACELSPLKQSKNISCPFVQAAKTDLWEQLSTSSTWLFQVINASIIEIDCEGSNRKWKNIHSQGILSLQEGCTARYKDLIFNAAQSIQSAYQATFTPSTWVKHIQSVNKVLVKPLDSNIINNSQRITTLMQEVQQIRSENTDLKGLHFHHVSSHAGFIISVIAIIIIVIYILKNKCRQKVPVIFRDIQMSNVRPQNV